MSAGAASPPPDRPPDRPPDHAPDRTADQPLSHDGPAPAIRRLPQPVAAQIAAGEVIERPASVVKELLENAVDAGATRVELLVEGAGLERIRLSDDGRGMPAAELALAFERHATSKLRAAADLWALRSYGFRGEALPSIAAVGEVDCLSRPREGEGQSGEHDRPNDQSPPPTPRQPAPQTAGALLRLRGGAPLPLEAAAAPPGTTIEVRELFARQPARRKFLGGERAERAAIARVCADQALARPQLALQLTLEGRRALRTGGEGQRRAVLAELWGAPAAAAALPFAGADPRAGLEVEGLAAPPLHHRARRGELRLFVNGRPVQSRRLSYALQEAYRELLPARRFPLVACFLAVDPARVDVNVHPAKAQVKLADEDAAFALIQRSLRAALLGERPARQRQPAGFPPDRPAPENPTPENPVIDRDAPPAWLRADPSRANGALANGALANGALAQAVPAEGQAPGTLLERLRPGPPRPESGSQAGFEGASTGATPPLRALGQIDAAFLVAEGPDGLYLIDQHAAHERVLYEQLLGSESSQHESADRERADDEAAGLIARRPAPAQQALLDLAPVELSAAQAAALAEFAPALRALGWEADPFGERALRLRALPAALTRGLGGAGADAPARDPAARLTAVLDELAESPAQDALGRKGEASEEPLRFDPAAAASACHSAVRAGDPLTPEAQRALLRALEACARPHTCPHGRPTLLRLPRDEILRRFLRR